MPKARIMIVENESVVAMDIRNRLVRMGYEVCGEALTGKEAVDMSEDKHPDLVLMDIKLQESMNGIEAASEIRKRIEVPVVYLTAYADDATLMQAKKTEPFGYILKPFEDRDLKATIEMALYKHKMEIQLRESEERYRRLAETAKEIILNLDLEGRITYVNQKGLDLSGYSKDEVLEKTLYDVLPEYQIESCRSLLAVGEQDGDVPIYCEGTFLDKSGRSIPVEVGSTMIIQDGRAAGLLIAARDLTDRRRSEETIQQRHRELSAINSLGHKVSGRLSIEDVITTALEHIDQTISPNLTVFFSREEGSLIMRAAAPEGVQHFDEEIPAHIVGQCLCGLAVTEKQAIYSKNIHTDDRCTWTECKRAGFRSFAALPLFSGNDVVGVLGLASKTERDFLEESSFLEATVNQVAIGLRNTHLYDETQRHAAQLKARLAELKQTKEQRSELQAQLLQAQKMEALGTLAAGIAHDFNNLLMGIQGNAGLMLFDVDPENPHHEKLKNIEEYVKKGADLTKQLLGFAKGGKYAVTPTDMNELVRKSAHLFARTRKDIMIHRTYQKPLRPVEADPGQLEQVLLNLFLNACQAMPGGGDIYVKTEHVELGELDIKPYALNPGAYVKISVRDTGEGMDETTQQRIFEPFFTTRETGGGTGLGLASAYGIIKNHYGLIKVTSQKGEGSTFEIFLPASGKSKTKTPEHPEEIVHGTETVLLVDDEQMIIEVARGLLEKMGYRVLIAGGGREALELYERHMEEIDVVILDMIMPDLNGGEVFDRMKTANPDVKVLLSSGYSIDSEAKKIMMRGCNGFIQKPFRMLDLSLKLRQIIESD